MRKFMLFSLMLGMIKVTLFGQILGNYKRSAPAMQQAQQEYSNAMPGGGVQYRSVAKTAYFVGDNVIELSINALSNQQADSYMALFNIVQLGKTAGETDAALNARVNTFLAELNGLGITGQDIYVDMVNFLPKFEIDVTKKLFSKTTYKEIPIGFELQKNIHIRFKDPSKISAIVTAASKQEIYDIVKVDYFVSDQQSVYADLRKSAFDYLNILKKQYKESGLAIDSAYTITAENAWVAYPGDRYESYQAYSVQALGPEDTKSVVRAEKPVSRFYDPIQGNDYDIVINPEILQPAVQYSYNLLVRLTLPERRPAVKLEKVKEFILVTPNGEVKALKIE